MDIQEITRSVLTETKSMQKSDLLTRTVTGHNANGHQKGKHNTLWHVSLTLRKSASADLRLASIFARSMATEKLLMNPL